MEFLSRIEASAFCVWVRESSSLWAYPGLMFLHSVGLAIVVGISAMVNLRLLGFAGGMPVWPLERFFPIMWAGLAVNALSGATLFAADATTKVMSPLFGVKMLLVGLAVVNLVLIRRVVFSHPNVDDPVSRFGKCLAAASLLLWFGAAAVGRLMTALG